MPYSSMIFDKEIKEVIRLLKPTNFLDIGAGAGKYGEMVKSINPKINAIALEIEKEYIKKFNLKEIYGDIWNFSANALLSPKYYDKKFDLVMIGDVIEHLKKSEGIDLINFLVYRSKWLIVKFPHKYLQNAFEGHNSEAHISVWSEKDFENFETSKLYKEKDMRLIVIKGYLPDKNSLMKIKKIIGKK